MNPDTLFSRYQELQQWIGWTEADAERVHSLAQKLRPIIPELVNDFYNEIQKHPEAAQVITGGPAQITRLKSTLAGWIADLLSGNYDKKYVLKRWQAGYRHVEIGLEQTYANASLSRLRRLMLEQIQACWPDDPTQVMSVSRSLSMLLDLDFAMIGDAYHSEFSKRLQRQERLATIGQVAGGIAHELRNPLNVIQTSTYYLQNAKNPTPEKVKEHLQRIERRVTTADQVIAAVSRFTKMDLPALEPFNVTQCLQESLKEANVPPEIEQDLDFPSQPSILAQGDDSQIRLVFSNLIRNACEAMPHGGRLSIRLKPTSEMINTEIEDTGSGIEPERLQQIMEPLYSTKTRGLGLGLAISKAVIDRHRGELFVVSEPGKGSVFTVRLLASNTGEN